MKRILRKVASIFIATAMVAAMGVSAFAADENENINGNGTVIGNNDPAAAALKKTLVIEKELTVYNPETTKVYAPNITYTYAIEGIDDPQKVVTDKDGVSATTKKGPSGATITDVSWANTEKVDASKTGTANTKDITIDFSNVTFSGTGEGAGVYRYKITETSTDKAANGIKEGTIANERYLDVYVRDPRSGENGYQIYGYVLFENNNNIDGRDSATTDTVAQAVKTEGFVATTSPSGNLTADSYYTYNVSVTKTLVNDSANETHAFPFDFAFTKDASLTGNFNLIASYAAADTPTEMGATISTTIAHGATVKYTGIPCGTEVEIVETNDIPTSAYKVTTTGADDNISGKLVNNGETTDKDNTTVKVKSTTVLTEAEKNFDITFTNTLELISPTGVAMAILPFVILLGFGIGFMVLGTTKRKEEYEV